MATITAFLHMGGYALYVWPAYGITVMILLGNYLAPVKRLRHLQRLLKQRHHASHP